VFFFQAEDGIRDDLVTGVQTCALPISQYALKTLSGGGRLFSGSQRAQVQGTHLRHHGPRPGEVYVAGLDVGGQDREAIANGREAIRRTGHDASVLTIARAVMPPSDAIVPEPRLEIVEHVAFSGTAHDALFARLTAVPGGGGRLSGG